MKQKTAQAFTLIELLIVIAVLGILAIAVLSAINPIEQINRSRDTGSRSDSEQLISAIERYYAGNSSGLYPWQVTDSDSVDLAFTPANADWVDSADAIVLDKLSETGTGELKQSFTDRISGQDPALNVYHAANESDSTYVCFIPQSMNFRATALDRCRNGITDLSDFPADACPNDETCIAAASTQDATGCYSCLP